MWKWLLSTVKRLKSDYTEAPGPGETNVSPDLDRVATLTVTYRVLRGTDAETLRVMANAETEFSDDASDIVRNATNTAADILCDKPSVGLFYGSIVSNMLYVPDKLREKPN